MKHPTKDIEATVGVLGCKHTTRDLIIGLGQAGLHVDHCVTIDPDLGRGQHVAGYYDLRGFCGEQGIGWTTASTYTLSSGGSTRWTSGRSECTARSSRCPMAEGAAR